MYILRHIVKPGVFLYFKDLNCFTDLEEKAYIFCKRENAQKIFELYNDLDLQIIEV